MKTIHKAIFRELLITFLLALAAFNIVLATENVIRLTKALASIGLSAADMGVVMLYLQPQFSLLTLPMALFIAVLLTYGRLNADNELIVLRTSGMTFADLTRPVMILGALCFMVSLLFSFYLAPKSTGLLKDYITETVSRRAPGAIEAGVFNSTFKNLIVFASEKTGPGRLKSVFIHDERNPAQPVTVYASEAEISRSSDNVVSIVLTNGHIYFIEDTSSTDLAFGSYTLRVPITAQLLEKKRFELSPLGLLKEAKVQKGQKRLKLLIELHRRFTFPVLCLLLALLGPPLALRAGKTGKFSGLALGLGVFAAYYSALVYFENLIRGQSIPHYLGAWIPVLMLGVISIWLFKRQEAV